MTMMIILIKEAVWCLIRCLSLLYMLPPMESMGPSISVPNYFSGVIPQYMQLSRLLTAIIYK